MGEDYTDKEETRYRHAIDYLVLLSAIYFTCTIRQTNKIDRKTKQTVKTYSQDRQIKQTYIDKTDRQIHVNR